MLNQAIWYNKIPQTAFTAHRTYVRGGKKDARILDWMSETAKFGMALGKPDDIAISLLTPIVNDNAKLLALIDMGEGVDSLKQTRNRLIEQFQNRNELLQGLMHEIQLFE